MVLGAALQIIMSKLDLESKDIVNYVRLGYVVSWSPPLPRAATLLCAAACARAPLLYSPFPPSPHSFSLWHFRFIPASTLLLSPMRAALGTGPWEPAERPCQTATGGCLRARCICGIFLFIGLGVQRVLLDRLLLAVLDH